LPIHPDTVTSWFKDFVKKNNLPDITLHSLRHTNASLMIANGVDLRTVSKRLGHAQVSTTTNIYSHAIKSADERAADVLGDILTVKKSNRQA
jgi:Site-specific recombinase XerD